MPHQRTTCSRALTSRLRIEKKEINAYTTFRACASGARFSRIVRTLFEAVCGLHKVCWYDAVSTRRRVCRRSRCPASTETAGSPVSSHVFMGPDIAEMPRRAELASVCDELNVSVLAPLVGHRQRVAAAFGRRSWLTRRRASATGSWGVDRWRSAGGHRSVACCVGPWPHCGEGWRGGRGMSPHAPRRAVVRRRGKRVEPSGVRVLTSLRATNLRGLRACPRLVGPPVRASTTRPAGVGWER